MGEEPLQGKVGELFQFAQKRGGIGIGYPQAPHAGVDLEMDPGLAKELAGGQVERAGLFLREKGGGNVIAYAFALLAGIYPPQEEDRLVDAALAQLDPLGQEGDAEGVHPSPSSSRLMSMKPWP